MNETAKLITTLVLGILVGIVIGYFKGQLFCITWKSEIGLDSFINLLSAVVIAIFLAQAYQKRISNTRIEKDILITQINESIKTLREIRNDFRTSFTSHTISIETTSKINTNLRQLSNSIAATKDLSTALCYENVNKEIDDLLHNFIIYKQIITGGGMTEAFTGPEHQKQEAQYNKINVQLHAFIVMINRL